MKRADALALLAEAKPFLVNHFGVTHLALFGSTARDVARSDSDIDVLVALSIGLSEVETKKHRANNVRPVLLFAV